MKQLALRTLKKLLNKYGYTVGKIESNVKGYIDPNDTISEAEKHNKTASAYLREILKWNSSHTWLAELNKTGLMSTLLNKDVNVLEIGSGAGLFLEVLAEALKPVEYQSYEPSSIWADYLEKKYNVISQPCNGESLSSTKTDHVDLVVCNGVFVYIPLITTYKYWQEMIRVTKNGSYIVFDIFTEDCFTEELLKKWIDAQQSYPVLISESYAVNFFKNHNFDLVHSFYCGFGVGNCKYLVFKNNVSNEQ